jgi:uncharacterized hydrophobic protein (TIGR00271 family)
MGLMADPTGIAADIAGDDPARRLTASDLPTGVASLDVAPYLVDAQITSQEAEHLDYIVDQVYFTGRERRERQRRFAILIVLATMIASFGLLENSVAVVIGAMLVAPLMTPILGVAVSIVLTEPRRLIDSALTVLAGSLGAIAVGYVISMMAAGGVTPANLPSEVASRTSPGLLDLGVAIAAGLTGGYLMIDRKAAAGAAGVAIAVALVPPLATVGICLQVGTLPGALGALLLFSTNLVAIILAASAVILVAGVVPRRFIGVRFQHLRLGFAVAVAAVVVIAIPLGIHTRRIVEQEQFERLVAAAVTTWDPRTVVSELDTETDGLWSVSLEILTPSDRSATWQLAQLITEQSGQPIDLELVYINEERDRASTR